MPFKDAWLTSSNEYLLFTAVVIAVLMNIYILIAVFIAVLQLFYSCPHAYLDMKAVHRYLI